MNLTIKFIDKKPKKFNKILTVCGQLKINEDEENFCSPLDLWSINDYEKQWQEGLERIKTHDQSCLVVRIGNPIDNRFIEWWVLYKRRNKVYLQNHIIFGDIYEERIGNKEFNRETCYDFIHPRRIVSGGKISEQLVGSFIKNGKTRKLVMNLIIKVASKKIIEIEKDLSVQGRLIINGDKQNFLMPIDWWSIEEYKKQWQEGLERIKTHDQSCLIARITNPAENRYLEWYLLYKVKDKIYLQDRILFENLYNKQIGDKEFNRETCYDFIPKRTTKDDAYKISEWSVDYP